MNYKKRCIPPFGGRTAILLSSPPQVDKQSVLEGVDSFISVQTREAWLTLSLCLSVDC